MGVEEERSLLCCARNGHLMHACANYTKNRAMFLQIQKLEDMCRGPLKMIIKKEKKASIWKSDTKSIIMSGD